MKKISRSLYGYFPYVTLASLTLLAYSNTFHSSFHLDDIDTIINNPFIRGPLNLNVIWDAFHTRFVVGLSLALNYHWGKLDVFGYHLFNVSVHILASFLVYQLSILTLETPLLSGSILPKHKKLIGFFAACIFLVHPIQTQAVTYIWQRAASLATVFYLSSLVFYAKARVKSSKPYYLASLACMAAGMFSKETMITAPFAIALYEACFLGGAGARGIKRFYRVLPFLLLLPVIPLTLMLSPNISLELMTSPAEPSKAFFGLASITRFVSENEMPRSTYILTQINVLRTYLRLLFIPLRQNLDYDYPLANGFFERSTILSFTLLVSVFLFGLLLYRKHRLAAFGIFWFFLTLSVESFVPQNDVLFEHRLYLPMVGYSLFLAYGLYALVAKHSQKAWLIIMVVFAGLYAGLAFQRNFVWKDEVTLWNDVIKKSPQKARAYNALGYDSQVKGDLDKAISYYTEAIERNPDYAEAYSNRGVAYQMKNIMDKALVDFNKAVQTNPNYAQAFNNRGCILKTLGVFDRAFEAFDRAVQINPNYAKALNNRGSSYMGKGLPDKALADFDKAIQIDPDYAEAYYNRGCAYHAKGLLDRSISDFDKAIQLRPDFSEAHNNRGWLFQAKGLTAQAAIDFERAARIKSGLAETPDKH